MALCELAVLLMVLCVAHLAAGESAVSERRDSGVGAVSPQASAKTSTERARPGTPSPAARCPAAQKAIGHYRRAYTASRNAMSLTGAVPRVWYPCQAARRRAVEWRDKAWQAKRAYAKWHEYHYDWQKWLPYNWYRVGSCESGYGGPPNWEHTGHSRDGYFVSGFGISAREYDKDAAVYGAPPWHVRHTPRDQYLAALGHYKRFGDGWSCPGP